ncbi:YdaS family helix-turn-helix protein [Pseudomonas paeninsulae]|uniref:YdaS family helix-turn-helix protein n=1 Tax=Pseudomonas paeninsulae TaxID=3110772 RepID=UPI002D777A6C|nr:YdaS family helix-turn-helix protein [Pseudomonas sp. IT1137]
MGALKEAIEKIGGVTAAATVCGVSQRAIYKWLTTKSLPRTEYTGETKYAEKLAEASGGKFTAEWLLQESSPGKIAQEADDTPKAAA